MRLSFSKHVLDNNVRKIGGLHPAIRKDATAFLDHFLQEEQTELFITHGFRTFEEQDLLFDKGRGTGTKIVTFAKGGESYHNYGLAFDVIPWNYKDHIADYQNWSIIGAVGKRFGFTWGGDFETFHDRRHFQKTFGYDYRTLRQLLAQNQLSDGFAILNDHV